MSPKPEPYDYEVPYDQNGNLMHYPMTVADYSGVTYVDACPEGTCGTLRDSWFFDRVVHKRRPVGSVVYPEIDWRANDVFHASLELKPEMSRGRSAKYVHWGAVGGDQPGQPSVDFPMFVKDLVDIVRNAPVERGVVSGRWRVRKRGANYGLIWWGDR